VATAFGLPLLVFAIFSFADRPWVDAASAGVVILGGIVAVGIGILSREARKNPRMRIAGVLIGAGCLAIGAVLAFGGLEQEQVVFSHLWKLGFLGLVGGSVLLIVGVQGGSGERDPSASE
jgi:hypothetical protein